MCFGVCFFNFINNSFLFIHLSRYILWNPKYPKWSARKFKVAYSSVPKLWFKFTLLQSNNNPCKHFRNSIKPMCQKNLKKKKITERCLEKFYSRKLESKQKGNYYSGLISCLSTLKLIYWFSRQKGLESSRSMPIKVVESGYV